MSYRVETAVSGRAGCQDAECKKANIKIEKDELRFGTWVEIMGNGSWRWKHWGCMSGKQLQSLRTSLDPEGTGNYEWDRLDGYDSEEKGGLVAHPDLQEKVRRVITQGYIDKEDFNGDPEMNKLGESGIRTAASKKKLKEDAMAKTHDMDELKAKIAAVEAERDALKESAKKKKPTSKKRAKKEESDEEDAFEESKPAPKKRATKVMKDEVASDGERASEIKAKPKRGRKSAVKEEVVDEQNGLGDAPEAKPKAAPKKGRKKAVKEEHVEKNGVGEAPETEIKPKLAARKARKKAVKKEEPEVEAAVKDEVKDALIETSSSISDTTPATVVKNEEAEVEDSRSKKKGTKAKKVKAAAPKSTSTRVGRSRTASKNESQ